MDTCTPQEILPIIFKSKISGGCNLQAEDWEFIATELIADFPQHTIEFVNTAIMKGMKGYYDSGDFVNMKTIYGWIFSHKKFMIAKTQAKREFVHKQMSSLIYNHNGLTQQENDLTEKDLKAQDASLIEIIKKLEFNNREELAERKYPTDTRPAIRMV